MRSHFVAGAFLVVAQVACGGTTARAPDASPLDSSTDGDGSPEASEVRSPPDASDRPAFADATDLADDGDATTASEDGCVEADATTSGPYGGCCPGLVITQSRTTGQFICVPCVGEGQLTYGSFSQDCCSGLTAIVSGSGPPDINRGLLFNCDIGLDSRVCSRCGDGVCDDWEKPCGCPQDCGAACGTKNCAVGDYCLENAPRSDGGTTPEYLCVDVASDCPDGVPSCQCGTAKQCSGGCNSLGERSIVRCNGP